MPDKRKTKRRHIIYYLRVLDRKTNELTGQLVDITTEGMKLISENPIEPDTFLQLKMLLPEDINRKSEISFDVHTMWCKRDINPNFFSIGFEFADILQEDVNIIKNLIYDFSFRD
ncbi:MAG: PilZ domain-containing protein [Desulfococcaceae bacterium]|nr:PilZ domain-containing protein [Desulfococcaceae bacterium]